MQLIRNRDRLVTELGSIFKREHFAAGVPAGVVSVFSENYQFAAAIEQAAVSSSEVVDSVKMKAQAEDAMVIG